MSTPQTAFAGPSALDWMQLNQMHIPHKANEVSSKSIPVWTSIAAIPFLAMSNFATNRSLDYSVHFDTGHTNPVISMPNDAPVDWMDLENHELGSFLSFLDNQMAEHSDLVEPADEAQLDRLAKLLAKVKV
jgi:hypothetical protein